MNKDYTNLSIKRTLDARLRIIAIKNQRTPQGQIDFWCKKEETKEVDLATLEKILEKDI